MQQGSIARVGIQQFSLGQTCSWLSSSHPRRYMHGLPQMYLLWCMRFYWSLKKIVSLNRLRNNAPYVACLTRVLLQVFGDKAFEKYGKGFISMHFSDQHVGTHKKMLVFKFSLPDANHMAEMTRLVALVPYYIDLIGRYKLSPQVGVGQILFKLLSVHLVCSVYPFNFIMCCVYNRVAPRLKQRDRRLPKRHTRNFKMPGKK